MDRSRIGIVIPALNEAATIAAVVSGVLPYGLPLVVDDGSSDNTAELALAAGARVKTHSINAGYDAALNTGFALAAESGCEYILTVDADGQHNPGILPQFIAALEGADLALGVRDRRQRFAEHLFAWLSRPLWGISDPLCGLKGYRISLYRELGHFDSYGSIGTELAVFAARRKSKIVQLPVRTGDRAGVPRFGRRFRANLLILRAMLLAFYQRDT
ncbi:MAG: glycosyltransferase family 2 protein [Desulfurivibrio sp.]|nr:glycosyltransferase family 2 protein [Desulfurivibrio sp.]